MSIRSLAAACCLVLAAAPAFAADYGNTSSATERSTRTTGMTAEQSFGPAPLDLIAGWPQVSREAAQFAIDKYGNPDTWSADMLHWYDAGPFAMMTVSSRPVDHAFPAPHQDVFEQGIYFEVPAHKVDELTVFDGSVKVDRTKGILSARCDKEMYNFLALNLVVDLINDDITVQEAREQYAQIALGYKQGGTSHPYLMALNFTPASMVLAADPDGAFSRVAAGQPAAQPGYQRSGLRTWGEDPRDTMITSYSDGIRYDADGNRIWYSPYTRADGSGYKVASRIDNDDWSRTTYYMGDRWYDRDAHYWYSSGDRWHGNDCCCWDRCCW